MIIGKLINEKPLIGIFVDGGHTPAPPGRVGDHFVGELSSFPAPIVLTSSVKNYSIEEE